MEKNCNNLDINEVKEIWKDIEDDDEQTSDNPASKIKNIANPNDILEINPKVYITVEKFLDHYFEIGDLVDRDYEYIQELKAELEGELKKEENAEDSILPAYFQKSDVPDNVKVSNEKNNGYLTFGYPDNQIFEHLDKLVELQHGKFSSLVNLIFEYRELAELHYLRGKVIENLKGNLSRLKNRDKRNEEEMSQSIEK